MGLEPQVLTFEQFATQRGASRQDIGEAGFHCGAAHIPKRARAAQMRRQNAKDDDLLRRRSELRAEYDRLCAAGEVRPPTHRERLEWAANGDPDKESTQAARRTLARLGGAP